ncbi:hypothetical protein [Citrobacter tructae]|uniref:Uncharacterized protein n=1 Tax=Citrobacter tructae TaxID=2562449 RepID=A0ABX5T2C7_9ENTR|nr:hypothetical protein [Citrobacter tructae]QBX80614.1 hypothetical protein E4Z61_09680 [Citrobacter tructae]
MNELEKHGLELRTKAKELALAALAKHPDGQKNGKGIKQSEVFNLCGFGWGEKSKATNSNQQYWVVALLRQLEDEGLVEQIKESGPWRLK